MSIPNASFPSVSGQPGTGKSSPEAPGAQSQQEARGRVCVRGPPAAVLAAVHVDGLCWPAVSGLGSGSWAKNAEGRFNLQGIRGMNGDPPRGVGEPLLPPRRI